MTSVMNCGVAYMDGDGAKVKHGRRCYFPKAKTPPLRLYPRPIKGKTRAPNCGLIFSGPKSVRCYGTPRCHPITWYVSKKLTTRGFHDLGNCIGYEESFNKFLREHKLQRGRYVSAEFVEWLMGFPCGWTDASQPMSYQETEPNDTPKLSSACLS